MDLERYDLRQSQQQQQQQGQDRRAQARDIVTSWFLAIWAVGSSVYLMLGGARHLTSPSYTYVLAWTPGDYHSVAYALAVAAAINVVGVVFDRPWGIAIGSIAVGLWLAFMSFAMALAAWTIPDGGNMNMLTSSALAVCFFIRAYNKVKPPNVSGALSMVSLVAMWFV